MKIKYVLAIVFISIFFSVNAQTGKKEDVIYLKNESVLRGAIIYRDDRRVKIQTGDGSIWVCNLNDIVKISSENKFGSFSNNRKGFASYTELGPLVAGKTTIDGVTTAAFSFQTINGYRFSRYFFLGAGAGADLYATQTILPLFTSIRGDFTGGGNIIPFYFADGGYGINITQNSAGSTDFKGGLLYAAGLGAKIPFNHGAGFLISFGYRYQTTEYQLNGTKTTVQYSRLAVRAGFFF